MSKPSFSQLKQINDLYKQIDSLQLEIESLESQLGKIKISNKLKEDSEKQRLTLSLKQEILLEKIKNELNSLRDQEENLRNQVNTAIDEAISAYFGEGHFAEFVNMLLDKIKKTKEDYKVITNKFYSTYLPKGQDFEEVEGGETFRIDLGYKTYVLDIDHIKSLLKEKLVQTKISSLQIDPTKIEVNLPA